MRHLAQDRPLLVDGALAAALVAVSVVGAAVAASRPGEPRLTPAAVALLAATCVPLTWRRRAPVVVWALAGTAAAVFGVRDYPDPVPLLGPLVALYSVIVHGSDRIARIAVAVTVAAGLAAAMAAGDSDAQDYYVIVVSVALAWALAAHQRARGRALAQETEQAVAAERAGIARELHDVVAHHVSMIVVQAEAGAATAGNGDGATGFDGIADSGRQALSELRRLLGVLRAEGEPTALSPQPGVEDLGELVGQLQSAGLPAELRVEGPVRPLPAAVSLSAYRIVQEALTNVVRHAGPARAMVRVRYDADTIDLEVADDGVGATSMTDGGARHGLVGIRERVEIFGGRLEAGPRPGGGFAVRAWLPTRG